MKNKQRRKRKQILLVTGGAILLGIGLLVTFLYLARSQGPVTSLYKDPTYVSPFTDEIAQQLHLSTSQLKTQALAGKSIVDIAAEQRLSLTQLHTIELNAFQHLYDSAIKNGLVMQQDEDQTLQQYRSDMQLMDNKTYQLITGTSR